MKKRNIKGQFIYTGGLEKSIKDKACPDCGKMIMRQSSHCRGCAQKEDRGPRYSASTKYSALHYWVRKKLGNPKKCFNCGSTDSRCYNWHNINYLYKRNVEDWIYLCRSCHMKLNRNRKEPAYV